MSVGLLSLIILALAALGFAAGRARALAAVAGDARKLSALPPAYGWSVALFTAVPALLALVLWLLAQPVIVENRVLAHIGPENAAQSALMMGDMRRIAAGLASLDTSTVADPETLRAALADKGVALGEDVTPAMLTAAQDYRKLTSAGRAGMTATVLGLALAFGFWAWRRVTPQMRARRVVETFVHALLIAASMVAVLTTIGIIFSLVFESWHFFQIYPAQDFFLNLTWNPQFRGGSDLGLWPLVWGTLYISLIALVVAVPTGLMAAIYLSEYASPRIRTLAKPALEVLAGIPSIVYGLFALITIGPFLRDWFASPMGLGDSASSVATAGLVMGIMLIPYVSSLSDDIINAVPQSLRDGSYALGSTQSETIRQVVFPAALPGIVGAILLAASRAIGETMIVVLGAGASAKLSLNPFEAMTTVTVKIVSQLTGDSEFASPETLVAFALGLTLFCFTLALNVLALHIVRKYREQYE